MRPHTLPTGQVVHIGGRQRPKQTRETHPHLYKALLKYVAPASLPTAPAVVDYITPCKAAMSMILANGGDPTVPANEQPLGDCTSAGRSHIIDATTCEGGAPVVMTGVQTIAWYAKSCNYVPGDPSTDNGGDEVAVCNMWRDSGKAFDGHGILGWLAIPIDSLDLPTLTALVRSLLYVCGPCLYFGMELADPWLDVNGDGFVWDVGSPPNPANGHCVMGGGADDQGVMIDSWGFIGKITWAAIKQFCSEAAGGNLFLVLTDAVVNKLTGKTPTGFDLPTLVQDFDAEGGTVPVPPPSPDPPPAPPGPAPDPTTDPGVVNLGSGDTQPVGPEEKT